MTEASQRVPRPTVVTPSEAPSAPVVQPVARRAEAPTKTANLQALAFKVSPPFRKRFRQRAANADLKLNELLFEALDAPGQPFHDPAANAALFEELEACVVKTPDRIVRRLPLHINDRGFAEVLVQTFRNLQPAEEISQRPV